MSLEAVMKNHYLLIVNNTWKEDGSPISAEVVALRRLERGLWNLYENTPHRKNIVEGDKVIIYLAGSGPHGKSFAGKAVIDGISADCKSLKDLYGDPPVAALKLREIILFPNFPPIAQIKDELDFVPKNSPKWGCVMQRGLKRISDKDFNTIIAFVEIGQ